MAALTVLRMTVHDASAGRRQDVEVSAAPETPVGSLLAVLPFPVGERHCYVGTDFLDPASVLADSPLVHGCTVTIGATDPDHGMRPAGAAGLLRAVAGPDRGRQT